MTHLSDGALHVCRLEGLPLVELSCVGWLVMLVLEGVGGVVVAGVLEELVGVGGLGELLDGTFG